MDPVTAFQTAAAVFQFVGVLYDVATAAYDIYDSSSGMDKSSASLLEQANKIDPAASRVKDGLTILRSRGQKLDTDERRLEKVAEQCLELSSSITKATSQLRPSPRHRLVQSVKLGVLSFIKKNDLQKMKDNLTSLRQELQLELLINLWYVYVLILSFRITR